jgi:hypothetical protein
MVSNKLLIPTVAILVGGGIIWGGTRQISAQGNENRLAGLVQMISQRFNLKQEDVQSVFDQYQTQQKEQRQADRQKFEEHRLNKFVADGKITETQKQAIMEEMKVLMEKYNPQNWKNMTKEQIQAQIQAERDEISNWAKTQGIDPNSIGARFGFGKGIAREEKEGWHERWEREKPPTPTE